MARADRRCWMAAISDTQFAPGDSSGNSFGCADSTRKNISHMPCSGQRLDIHPPSSRGAHIQPCCWLIGLPVCHG